MTTEQAQTLTTAQVATLSTSQVAALQTADLSSLKTTQIVSLTTAGIAALSSSQIQSLKTSQIAALTTKQVVAITTDNVAALTTVQVSAFTTRQVEAFTNPQVAALGTTNVQYLTAGTPIVLDLNGNGISTQSINNGVKFDIFGVGKDVNTGWVSGGDGLLVMDRNHDGSVSGGGELFGVGTTLANGQRAGNGYLALGELDSNSDGVINADDANFADLMVWVDGDSDGTSQAPELHSLSSLGITQLDLTAQKSSLEDNGNMVGLVSSYTTADGEQHAMADVWFATSQTSAPPVVGGAVNGPPTLVDVVAPPAQNASQAVGVAAASVEPDLRTQVSSLVDVMSTFDSSGRQLATDATSETQLNVGLAGATSIPVLAGNLVGMVDALKQFDANGQALHGPKMSAAASASTLESKPRRPDVDILANGK